MTDETPGKPGGKKTGQAESERARELRQAAALRENLRKRNAQRRKRQSTAPDSGPGDDDV
tara:strand:- start:58293 stop:58472 length:180 start_codon:yes stop_codon:yes gene_type:complete